MFKLLASNNNSNEYVISQDGVNILVKVSKDGKILSSERYYVSKEISSVKTGIGSYEFG